MSFWVASMAFPLGILVLLDDVEQRRTGRQGIDGERQRGEGKEGEEGTHGRLSGKGFAEAGGLRIVYETAGAQDHGGLQRDGEHHVLILCVLQILLVIVRIDRSGLQVVNHAFALAEGGHQLVDGERVLCHGHVAGMVYGTKGNRGVGGGCEYHRVRIGARWTVDSITVLPSSRTLRKLAETYLCPRFSALINPF